MLFVDLMNDLIKGQNLSYPYTERNYAILPQIVSADAGLPEFALVEIRMPKPEGMPLCSRVYICHDNKFENIRYYTLEISFDTSYVLCGWEEDGAHINYGNVPDADSERCKKVIKIYTNFLKRKT